MRVFLLGLIAFCCYACTKDEQNADSAGKGSGGQEQGGSSGATTHGGNGGGGTSSEAGKPSSCEYENVVYRTFDIVSEEYVGDSYMGEKLRTCTCDDTGEVSCDAEVVSDPDPEANRPDCSYNQESYYIGNTFSATDGCNTCECVSVGETTCTTVDCGCDKADEPSRTYLSPSVFDCDSVVITCADGYSPFSNRCGCGCEPSAS